jgi:hypothetical protein
MISGWMYRFITSFTTDNYISLTSGQRIDMRQLLMNASGWTVFLLVLSSLIFGNDPVTKFINYVAVITLIATGINLFFFDEKKS